MPARKSRTLPGLLYPAVRRGTCGVERTVFDAEGDAVRRGEQTSGALGDDGRVERLVGFPPCLDVLLAQPGLV